MDPLIDLLHKCGHIKGESKTVRRFAVCHTVLHGQKVANNGRAMQQCLKKKAGKMVRLHAQYV